MREQRVVVHHTREMTGDLVHISIHKNERAYISWKMIHRHLGITVIKEEWGQ